MCWAHFLKIRFVCFGFLFLGLLIPVENFAGDGQSGVPSGRQDELESLLNPKALTPDRPVSPAEKLIEGFLNPRRIIARCRFGFGTTN